MNLSEYQTISARTAPTDLCDKERRTNAAWGLIGEFGEVVDLLKKMRFQGNTDRARLRDEFGDVMWYLAECFSVYRWVMYDTKVTVPPPYSVATIAYSVASDALDVEEGCPSPYKLCVLAGDIVRLIEDHGFTLDEVLEHNVAKLRKRYPDGFSVAASINRGAT